MYGFIRTSIYYRKCRDGMKKKDIGMDFTSKVPDVVDKL
jgi:hypothetical protein